MSELNKAFVKLTLLAVLGLFLVPGLAFWFTGHADPGGVHAQFRIARALSGGLLALGVATLALIGGLALLAYRVPRRQIAAFVGGWWSLRAISAVEIALQGVLLVWLSYWLTAYFLHFYFVKLILVAVVLAGVGIVSALAAIFRRVPMDNAVTGELIDEAQAPQLWARVRELSHALGTEPPKQMVGGIDANFFVAQAPMRVNDAPISGRTLYVSLPLLRAIERDEADAILAHEMAHFSGGDTETSAELGPKLAAYAHYMQALGANALTLLALFVLNLFRAAFELALSRDNRSREFRADAKAVALTSPGALSRALVRVSAYANYRYTVERELFEQRAKHAGPLDVGDRVARGLPAFTQTPAFQGAMDSAAVPHPFDSHPPLKQRMEQAGAVIAPADFAAIVAAPPARTWIEYVPAANEIEQRLWQRYEAEFADAHEQSLACRYEPANDAERAIVLKHFPDVEFALKKQARLRVTHAGIDGPDASVAWDQVAKLQYDDGSFGTHDTLTVTHPDKGMLGTSKTSKIKFALAGKDRDRLKATIGQYWQRHQVMRKLQAEAAAATRQ
jgi:Zn-dependent protease with chaperone function